MKRNHSYVKETPLNEQIVIPMTSERRYISGKAALNLLAPEGTSGDWHFCATFMSFMLRLVSDDLLLAGDGEQVNTNSIYGAFGIYECSSTLAKRNLMAEGERSYAANHYRAILDLLYHRITTYGNAQDLVGATEDWLDTDEQKEILLNKALEMLPHLDKDQKEELLRWVENERKPGYRS